MEKNNPGGFTLFELIIVLIIVSLISSLVMPRLFNSLAHVELKNAARRTRSLLHQARDIAYFQKKRIKVSFDLETDQITIFRYHNKKFEPVNSLGYSYPESIEIKKYQNKDKEVAQGRFDIFFSPNGNSSGGEITLGNHKRKVCKIEVDFITGSARILK